jgi:hypothetical protein
MNLTKTKIAASAAAVLLLGTVAAVMLVPSCRTGEETPGGPAPEAGNPLTPAGEAGAGEKIAATPVDMTASYTTPASYFDNITQFPAWKTVPRGYQVFGHVPLQIGGMICLWGGGNAERGLVFPEQRLGIPIHQKFDMLYVYHGVFYPSPDGTPVYELVFRYADGTSATNQILYGADLIDWYAPRSEPVAGPTGPNSILAWHGDVSPSATGQAVRFSLTTVRNRKPGVEVGTIDLYSCKSQSAGCILAFSTR